MKMAATGRMIPGSMMERTAPVTEVKLLAVTEVSLLAPTHLMPIFLPRVVKGSKAT